MVLYDYREGSRPAWIDEIVNKHPDTIFRSLAEFGEHFVIGTLKIKQILTMRERQIGGISDTGEKQ